MTPILQRCLNTNTLGIVIYQSRYSTRRVSNIKSIADAVFAWQYATFSIFYVLDKITSNRLNFPERGIEMDTTDQTTSTLDYTEEY